MITAIVQARMSSTRLPGKVLIEFSGDTLLGHIINRISQAKSISDVVIATTVNPIDDKLVDWLERRKVKYHRGDEGNVLNRYFETAKTYKATHIARITSDDPFKDPQIIDQVANMYFEENLDFAYNNKPPSFAEGLDTEIFSMNALTQAEQQSADPFEREHVTQYFYRNPTKFRQRNFGSKVDFSHLRWTIDTEEDLLLAKEVYKNLHREGKVFLTNEILNFLEKHPEVAMLNNEVKRSDMYKKKQ